MATTRKSGLLALVLVGFAAMLIFEQGCEPGSDENIKLHQILARTPPELVAAVGIDVCGVCHTRQAGEWLRGQHGTAYVFDANGLDSAGHPDYADFYNNDGTLKTTSTGHFCADCHDPLGDGRLLEPGYTGNVDRPVIGCESCHGGGAEHFGVGNIPFGKPDASRCGQCHNQDFDHNAYHPNADNIFEDYSMSGHAHSINSHNLAANGQDVRARCSRCHTDEGFRKYVAQVPGTTGHDSIEDFFADKPDMTDPSDVTCRTCHDPHTANGEDLTRIEAGNVNGDTQSSEFNTCTSCHQLVNDQGTVLAGATIIWAGTVGDSAILNGDSFGYHDPRINPYGSYDEIIADSHAALPGDARGNYGLVANPEALYYVKKGDPNACAVCHSPHLGSAEINRAYAQSGHGDPLAAPWVDDPWPQDGKQTACKRCHTSTGYKFYANGLRDGATYDPTLLTGEFAWLNDGATIHNETLYCWACHAVTSGPHRGENSYKGEIRNPGPYYLLNYTGGASFPAGNIRAKYLPLTPFYLALSGDTVFPDLSGSNVCLPCHTGRESGGNIQNANLAWPGHTAQTTFANIQFKNSHYLAAGGVMFREIGYEYYAHEGVPGSTVAPNYSNQAYYEHDIIGTPAAGNTVNAIAGLNGPCAGCHMHSAAGEAARHSFSPIELVGNTEEIVSPSCAACHNGGHEMTVEEIEENEAGFHAGLEAIRVAAINQGGWYWKKCNPYVFNQDCDCSGDPVVVGVACSNSIRATNWCDGAAAPCLADGKNNMGALFNLNMLDHEPGAFVHNRYYAKRLIYDSIDWLDNKTMDMSVAASLPGLLTGNTLAEAQGYLLKNGLRP